VDRGTSRGPGEGVPVPADIVTPSSGPSGHLLPYGEKGTKVAPWNRNDSDQVDHALGWVQAAAEDAAGANVGLVDRGEAGRIERSLGGFE